MSDADREFVRSHVLRVMADWSVVPSGRGSGPGDVENWIDYILDVDQQRPPNERGWNAYWENVRMPREFLEKGYVKGGHPKPPPVPASDPYMVKLQAIHDDIQIIKVNNMALLNGLRRFLE